MLIDLNEDYMKILKNLKQNSLLGLALGVGVLLGACEETEPTPSIDYSEKTLITSEKLLDKSGVYIMDADAKKTFKDSLGDGKLPEPHDGKVLNLSFDDSDSRLYITDNSSGNGLMDCNIGYEISDSGIKLSGVWIQSDEVECPSSDIDKLEMEITENYLLIKGAEFIRNGWGATTDYVMIFRRVEEAK
jgi:hypothetical protein